MRNDKAERDSTGRIKPGKTAPYVKKGMVNRLDLWYTDYIYRAGNVRLLTKLVQKEY